MAVGDRQHVEATSILNRLVDEAPHPSGEVLEAAEQWLKENRPSPAAYVEAARSVGEEVTEEAMTERQDREAKVHEAVRGWLPELITPGSVIQVKALDPDENDGALFVVTRTGAFICRQKDGR